MNKNNHKESSNNTKRLGTLAAISASMILAVFGIWYVIGMLQPAPDTLPPTATPTVATALFVTKVVTIAPTNTPTPSAGIPSPVATPTGNVPLVLAIVHSNDTWGYTQPCG